MLEQALKLNQAGNHNNGTVGWSYSLADSALDFLGEGQTATVVSTIALDDHHGGTDTAQVTVTITGKNDAPAITVESGDSSVANLKETNAGATSGTLTVSDADVTDHVTVGIDQIKVYLDGVLQTDPVDGLSNATLLSYLAVPSGDVLDGTATHTQFIWNFNSNGQAFDFLAAGQTLSLQYTIVPDDSHTPTGTGSEVVTINIAGSNDAPTLDATTLASVSSGDTDPNGSTVSALFAGKFHDVDDGASLKAIAVTADHATEGQGVWQYEVAGSDQWITIDGVSDTSALVLSSDTLVRFVPADGFSGAPGALDVHALDDTYTGAVTTASPASIDITSAGIGHGGTTPVSDQAASISTEVQDTAGGPVIDTASFSVSHDGESNTDTITGLQVVDKDSGASTDTFTVTATTAHPDNSSVSLPTASGLLSAINTAFADGITYDPGDTPPDTDEITLTVSDSSGHSDAVHFIFDEAASGEGLTLYGTSGKDVIFATDNNDTLIGNGGKDQFVFAPTSSQDTVQHTINDYVTGLDKIDLRQFDKITSWTGVIIAQQGNDTVLTLDDHDKILLKNVTATNLHANDFIVHVT